MRRYGPFEPIDPNIRVWGGVPDVINPAKFFENRPKGFGATRPRNLAFPIDFAGRTYNTLTLPCEVWAHDVMFLSNSGFNIFRGFRSTGGQNLHCPIDFAGHIYNSADATAQPGITTFIICPMIAIA